MRFSVTYPLVSHPSHPDLLTREAVVRFCQVAERSGFDGVCFTDHPAPTAKWLRSGGHDALDPFVALSFCSALTERIRLIPNIVVLPYRHPLIVAKMVATLDRLSGGRFTLAVATGYLRGEYKALGVAFEERNLLFDQAVEVLRGVWSEGEFSYVGAGIEAEALAANPRPDRPPPLWIGGNSRRSRERVAAYGDGWAPFTAPGRLSRTTKTPPLETVDDLAGMLDDLWRLVAEAGRDRSEIDVAFGIPGTEAPGSRGFNAQVHMGGLARLSELGVTWVHTGVPGDSVARAVEALEQYGETVIRPSRS